MERLRPEKSGYRDGVQVNEKKHVGPSKVGIGESCWGARSSARGVMGGPDCPGGGLKSEGKKRSTREDFLGQKEATFDVERASSGLRAMGK